MVARNAAADDPQKREKRHEEAEPEFRALERRRPLEVMEVDALRELLGCPCSCHSLATLAASSVAQRHDGMHGAEQNERERKRNVHQQPAVQPVVYPILACQLACFIVIVFAVSDLS